MVTQQKEKGKLRKNGSFSVLLRKTKFFFCVTTEKE
jgi:hypothetical protein